MIPALVLTAGLATRLRPLSHLRAKAALPVAGVPMIGRILRWLAAAGVRSTVLNLHHLPHTIAEVVGDGTEFGLAVRYSWEPAVLGSAGGPRRALEFLAAPEFLIVNGDTLTDVDLPALVSAHEQSGALVTMALTPNTAPEKYGGMLMEPDGRITGVVLKGDRTPSFHFVGVQVASARAFAALPDHVRDETVRRLYPEIIVRQPGAIRGFVTHAEFCDIGTPRDYLEASLAFAARESYPMPGSNILWENARIEDGAHVERCILTAGVTVPAGARLSNVIVQEGMVTTPL